MTTKLFLFSLLTLIFSLAAAEPTILSYLIEVEE